MTTDFDDFEFTPALTVAATEGAASDLALASFTTTDPNSDATQFSASIDWGDGASGSGTITSNGGGSFSVAGHHAYAEEGSYPLAVTVTDASGAATTFTGAATVADASLTVTATAMTATGGASFNASVATFADADPNGVSADYIANIDWGDGSTSAGTISGPDGTGRFTVDGSHSYAGETGTFPIAVTVVDAGGATASTPPFVLATTPAQIAAGAATEDSLNQISITFSEAVNAADATNAANYELLFAGADGLFNTPDDVAYGLNPLSDDSVAHVVTLAPTLGGVAVSGDSLPAGKYELIVFSSGGKTIHDLAGNALDGDSNGTPGGDYVRAFTVKPDIDVGQFTADGTTNATLQYEVVHGPVSPFSLAFYRSPDSVFDASATTLGTISLTAAADLSAGIHTNTYAIGSLPGQIPLPGVSAKGTSAETALDYYLMAVADPTNAVAELNTSDGDNTGLFAGVYKPSSNSNIVYVHGTQVADTITVSPSGNNVVVDLDGTTYTYASSAVKGVHIRSHAGDDTVSGTVNGVAVSTPLSIWGGDGNDTLTGGSGNDLLSGGTGNNVLDGGGGSNTVFETGDVNFVLTNTSLVGPGSDSLANITVANLTGGAGSTFDVSGWTHGGKLTGSGGAEVLATKNSNLTLTNTLITAADGLVLKLSGIKLAGLTAGSGDDVIDASKFTGSATLAGGSGNDVLFGSKGAGLLLAGSGNQVLIGGAGNNLLVGGSGRDLLIGGGGTDALVAGTGDAILIGGTTSYDAVSATNLAALAAIMAEWGSGDSYATRVSDLLNGGGLNVVNGSPIVLNTATVVADKLANNLVGSTTALDWFFAGTADNVFNFNSATETKTQV